MIIADVFALPPAGALLGLDQGTKTIGIAVSDGERIAATPLETVRRSKFTTDAQRIFDLYDDRQCTGIILGLPLNMDGSAGPRVQSVQAFARNFLAIRDVPLCFWDERLSSAAVERTLLEADTRRDRRKQVIDKMAAAYILQGALDRRRS